MHRHIRFMTRKISAIKDLNHLIFSYKNLNPDIYCMGIFISMVQKMTGLPR